MKVIICVVFSIFIMLSCRKFEHIESSILDCELCSFAKSLNGTYRGDGFGVSVQHVNGMHDSITMKVEQLFMGKSRYEDSSIMHFATTFKFDNKVGEIHDTIQIKLNNGKVENEGYRQLVPVPDAADSYTSYYYLTPASISLHVEIYSDLGGNIPYLYAVLKK